MCNINILIKHNLKEQDNNKTPAFLMGVTSNSFIRNSDGDGLFTKNLLITSKGKINLFRYYDEIIKNDIIITHQRISTSGHTSKYIQPFQNEDFVLIHNGIMNDFVIKKRSDTYGFFTKFLKGFYKRNKTNREKSIIKGIKELLDNVKGSYSIALYDKKTSIIYYFKDDSTKINFYKNKNMLYITTLDDNFILCEKMFKHSFSELDIKDYVIYKIQIKHGRILTNSIGNIEHIINSNISFITHYDYEKENEKTQEKEKKEGFSSPSYVGDSIETRTFKPCYYCKNLTNLVNTKLSRRICDNCLIKIELDNERKQEVIKYKDFGYF